MTLSPELDAIREAMDKSTGDGRDHSGAIALADSYINTHSELAEEMSDWSLDKCVEAVGVFRRAGYETKQWEVEAWLLSRFEPQQIGGEYQAQVRIPGV